VNLTLTPAVVPWGGGDTCQYLSTCLVNGNVALDAGTLGFLGTPEEQAAVGHVFLTHAHLDHIASLPIFLENVYDLRAVSPVVHACREVLDVLQRDVFNDRLWPDFVSLSKQVRPFLRLAVLEPGETVVVEGLSVTAVPVSHVVPTFGFLLRDAGGTVAYIPDTGPTEDIWRRAADCADLRAVVVETTFPDEMAWLAETSQHLTPSLLRAELAKLGRAVPTYIVHLKARYRHVVRDQLAALGLPHVALMEPGRTYPF